MINTRILFLLLIFFNTGAQAQDFKFGKVSKAELEEKAHPIEPEAHAAILYREYKTIFNQSAEDGFYITTEVFERIKIYDKEGFNQATKLVRLYQGTNSSEELIKFKANTYNLVNGKVEDQKLKKEGIFEDEYNKYTKHFKFTMPNVKEGSVIEFRYTLKSSFIDNIDAYQMQENIPLNQYSLTFQAPEYFNYKTHQRGWHPINIKTSSKNRTMKYAYVPTTKSVTGQGYISSMKTEYSELEYVENEISVVESNIPSVKKEPLSGNIDNYKASLKLELSYTKFPNNTVKYYSTTWDDVSRSIYQSESFGQQIEKGNYLKDISDDVLASANNNAEKMIAIYDYVKNNIKWNNFTGVYAQNGIKKALKEKEGNVADINLSLVSLLKEAGINANPILVSTVSNGIPIFPTRNGFNYVIAGVEINNDVILLDAVNKYAAPDVLSTYVLNWQGRLIREDGSSNWIPLSSSKQAMNSVLAQINVDESLNTTGTIREQLTENFALNFREEFSTVSQETMLKRLEEKTKQFEIDNLEVNNLENNYKPIQLSFDFETDKVTETVGDKLIVSPTLFLSSDENPFMASERNLPIVYGFQQKNRYLISINLPEGYVVDSRPEDVLFSLPSDKGKYRYMFSQKNNKVSISIEFEINTESLPPSEYQAVKKFYEMMVAKEAEKIVLSKA